MARIPPSAVTVGLPGVSAQPIREASQIGGAVVGLTQAAVAFASARSEAQKAADLSARSGALEGAFAELQLELQRDATLGTVDATEAAFDAQAQGIAAEHLDQSDSDVVNAALAAQFPKTLLRARVAASQRGYVREKDGAIAALDVSDRQYGGEYALLSPLADGDEARLGLREIQARDTNLSGYLTEVQKVKRIQSFGLRVDTAHVRGMIDVGLYDEAEDLLLDPAELTGMDELKRQAMLRTLNTARDRADSDTKDERKAFEDDTERSALLTIALHVDEGEAEYTTDDLVRDAPNMSVAGLKAVRAAMVKQGVDIVNDKPTVTRLNDAIVAGSSTAADDITAAFVSDLFDQATYNILVSRNLSINDGTPSAAAYKDAYKDFKFLGAHQFETSAGTILEGVERINQATAEMDHFRQTHEQATPEQITERGTKIRERYGLVRKRTILSRPFPYKLDDRGATAEQLDGATAQLTEDLAAGVVDQWEYTRESKNIRAFRADIERIAAEAAAEKAAKGPSR